jgi:hypothetical protein
MMSHQIHDFSAADENTAGGGVSKAKQSKAGIRNLLQPTVTRNESSATFFERFVIGRISRVILRVVIGGSHF